jgi:cyclohexyl-isocyanide hydratase
MSASPVADPSAPTPERLQIGLLAFNDMLLLDLVGPWEVFSSVPWAQVHLIAPRAGPVKAAKGLRIEPTSTYADCPVLDVVCVPGGPGVAALMEDESTLAFLRRQADRARVVSAVCTGSLVLGAAGLLRGRRATCHWLSLPLVAAFGATPVDDRVVEDGPLITGGGVTAGIDFGLHVVARLWGQAVAERVQLGLEYAPAPPFDSGSPLRAPPARVNEVQQASAAMQAAREAVVARAAARLV